MEKHRPDLLSVLIDVDYSIGRRRISDALFIRFFFGVDLSPDSYAACVRATRISERGFIAQFCMFVGT